MLQHLTRSAILLAGCLAALVGCSRFNKREPTDPFAAHRPQADSGVVQANYEEGRPTQVISQEGYEEEPKGWERLRAENLKKSFKKAIGKGPSESYARARYSEGLDLFNQKDYKAAAKKLAEAADRWPDSSLEEDAMFMQAESLFFDDRYGKACDLYGELLKKYVNTRHLNTAVQRQFAIAQYWIKTEQVDPTWPVTPNLFDKTRPWFDTHGNGVAAFDSVRLNDPRGALADDAIMATANAFFLRQRYHDADYYYKLIRTDYPKSEFQVQAHLLGLQCKMKIYQGPEYDGQPLIEGEEIVDQLLVQFPHEIAEERDRLIRTKAEIRAQRAYREWHLAQFYEKGEYYGAAKYYYREIVKDFPGTEFAQRAEQRINELAGQPENPPDYFAFLDNVLGPPAGKPTVRR